MKVRLAQLATLSWLLLAGCTGPDFTTITAEPLRERWEASMQDSAVGWWYAGENDEHYYLVETRPLEQHAYMVSKEDVELSGVERKALSRNDADWSNLKRDQIRFR